MSAALVSAPPPEAAAELLRPGEVVWAKLNGPDAKLGSGVRVQLPEGPVDRFTGWRRVEIIDPAVLSARVIPVPGLALAVNTADDPAELYRPATMPAPRAAPSRSTTFPVGAGWNGWFVATVAAAIALTAMLVIALTIVLGG